MVPQSEHQSTGSTRDGCGVLLKAWCTDDYGVEVTVSTVPPVVAGPYTADGFKCPHGIMYWVEPTGDQVAQWATDGVR